MNIGRRSAAAAVAIALALAGLLVTAGPAHADDCVKHTNICGTVVNETGSSVRVCLAWHADGSYFSWYPNACTVNKDAYVRPHTTYGGSNDKDIDAIFVPPGGELDVTWSCKLHPGHHPTVLRPPAGRNWLRIPSDCIVHVKRVLT